MQRHFTATAFIIDSRGRTLLLWHRRLKRWMPPGGHVDENEMPEDTARRECREETGLDVDIIGDAAEDLFSKNPSEGRMLRKPIALLLENIPACEEPFDAAQSRRSEPAHQHMDFLYLARPIDENQVLTFEEREGSDMRWFTRAEIEALDEEKEIFANVKRYILSVLTQADGLFSAGDFPP